VATHHAQIEPGQDDTDVGDPYPTLVTLGVADDTILMVNLEAAGTLTIVGDDDAAMAVVRALAVELATSPLTDGTALVLPPGLKSLADACDPGRVAQVDGSEAVSRYATTHRTAVAGILADAGVEDLHEARCRGVAEDVLTPEVFIKPDMSIVAAPWSGVIAVTTGADSDQDTTSGWRLLLDPTGDARLDRLGLELHPQMLSAADFDAVIVMLATADRPSSPAAVEPGDIGDEHPTLDAGSADSLAVHAVLPEFGSRHARRWGIRRRSRAGAMVLVLGRVEVEGGDDDAVPHRRPRGTELVAYLALHPGASPHEIDEALWPGQRVTTQTRKQFVSRVRHWLGSTSDDQPSLPLVAEEGDYRLHPDVGCDWHDFIRLARRGLARGADGAGDLGAAIALVRGRPFLGVDPAGYTWAEPDIQEMISAIVDVSHALSATRLAQRDYRAAQEAAAQGLLAESCSELLFRDALRAAAARGDTDEAARLADRLRTQIEQLDPTAGPEEETVELLRELNMGVPRGLPPPAGPGDRRAPGTPPVAITPERAAPVRSKSRRHHLADAG